MTRRKGVAALKEKTTFDFSDSDRYSDNETHTAHKKPNTTTHTAEDFEQFNMQHTNTVHDQHNGQNTQTNTTQHSNMATTLTNHTQNTQTLYNENDKGHEFKLIMEKENINEIKTGQILTHLGIKKIRDIRKTGKNRIEITTTEKKEANTILTNPTINKIHLYKTFIPRQFIFSTGIVKDVPLDLTEADIIGSSQVQGDIAINKVERMFYWDKNTQSRKPSHSIKIEFRCTSLPRAMILFYVRKEIQYYIPKPIICRKCLRYGHVDKICKAPTKICINCTNETHAYSPDCDCMHCRKLCQKQCKYCCTEEHNTMNPACPQMIKQQKIKNIMITQHKSFIEAKQITENTNTDTNTTYANVVNHTKDIELLKKEISNLIELNKCLLQRVVSAEHIIETIASNETQNTTHASNTQTNTTNANNEDTNQANPTNQITPQISSTDKIQQVMNKIQEHRNLFINKRTKNKNTQITTNK